MSRHSGERQQITLKHSLCTDLIRQDKIVITLSVHKAFLLTEIRIKVGKQMLTIIISHKFEDEIMDTNTLNKRIGITLNPDF